MEDPEGTPEEKDSDGPDEAAGDQEPREQQEVPRIAPIPGMTAPLDDTTEEERQRHGAPAAPMPGSGPDQPAEARDSPDEPKDNSERPPDSPDDSADDLSG